jgi:hypothetical protein
VVEPALPRERTLQRILACMAERRMPDVMRQRQRLGQILVEPERARDRPRDLRDFQAVRQANAKVVPVRSRRKLIEWTIRSRSRWNASRGPRTDVASPAPGRSSCSRPRLCSGRLAQRAILLIYPAIS